MSHQSSPWLMLWPLGPNPAIDMLSDLPEHLLLEILAYLPSHLAARTALLSSRFRYLWRCTPVVNLNRAAFRLARRFVSSSNRVLRMRNPEFYFTHLRINTGECHHKPLPIASVCSWISTAYSLGMRHLSLGIHCEVLSSIAPIIFSCEMLESLSIRFDHPKFCPNEESVLPLSRIPLIHLKSLEIEYGCPHDLGRFIRALPSLEHLHLRDLLSLPKLFSQTVKILEISGTWFAPREVHLHLPSLERMDFTVNVQFTDAVKFHGVFPTVKTAVIKLVNFDRRHVPFVGSMLSNLVNISTLSLCILPVMLDSEPYNLLFEPEKEPPVVLPNLESFDLFTCIRKETIEDIISLLDYLPSLDILKLTRLDPIDAPWKLGCVEWPFKPFPSYDGHICFTSLHLENKKAELVKFLSGRRQLSKRVKK